MDDGGKAIGGDALRAENARLAAEVGRLRAALRVNLLQLSPCATHDEIDALLDRLADGDA